MGSNPTPSATRVEADDEEARALSFLTREADRLLVRRAARQGGQAAREVRRLHQRRWGGPRGDGAPSEPIERNLQRALVIDDLVPQANRDAGSAAILSHMRTLRALGYEVSFAAARVLDALGEALGGLVSAKTAIRV